MNQPTTITPYGIIRSTSPLAGNFHPTTKIKPRLLLLKASNKTQLLAMTFAPSRPGCHDLVVPWLRWSSLVCCCLRKKALTLLRIFVKRLWRLNIFLLSLVEFKVDTCRMGRNWAPWKVSDLHAKNPITHITGSCWCTSEDDCQRKVAQFYFKQNVDTVEDAIKLIQQQEVSFSFVLLDVSFSLQFKTVGCIQSQLSVRQPKTFQRKR